MIRYSIFSFTIILFIVSFSTSIAQYKRMQFEIVPFGGFLLTGNLQTLDGELKIDNNFDYGGVINVRFSKDLLVELLYNRSVTEVSLRQENTNISEYLFDMSIEYFQAGVQVETEPGPLRPFAAFTLGVTYFKPKDYSYEGNIQFSFTAGGGIKYYFSRNVGVRAQWRFLVPVYISGSSVYCQNGYCQIFVSGGTYILQYDITAGLIFSF